MCTQLSRIRPPGWSAMDLLAGVHSALGDVAPLTGAHAAAVHASAVRRSARLPASGK